MGSHYWGIKFTKSSADVSLTEIIHRFENQFIRSDSLSWFEFCPSGHVAKQNKHSYRSDSAAQISLYGGSLPSGPAPKPNKGGLKRRAILGQGFINLCLHGNMKPTIAPAPPFLTAFVFFSSIRVTSQNHLHPQALCYNPHPSNPTTTKMGMTLTHRE